MLKAVRCADAARVLAWDASKDEQPFQCPECAAQVVLKQGRIRTAHFAHRPPVTCLFGRGETEAHRQCKQALYDGLRAHPDASHVQIEFRVGGQRADVYARIRGVRVAFEVQVSTLRPDDLERRTAGYARAGVAVCWMHPYTQDGIGEGIDNARYNPKHWERWIHAANFGRVYYWTEGLFVQPVHFAAHMLQSEARSWYDSEGDEHSAGGYERHSKRFRTPLVGSVAHIIDNFAASARTRFITDSMRVPACNVYVDRQRVWWPRRD